MDGPEGSLDSRLPPKQDLAAFVWILCFLFLFVSPKILLVYRTVLVQLLHL